MSAWRPIAEAEAVTAYILWDPDHGLCTGFYYDGCWQTIVTPGCIPMRLNPIYFQPAPEPPA